MAKESNWIWWTIGGIAVLGLGVGAFIFFKDRKNKKAAETTSEETPETTYTPTPTTSGGSTAPTLSDTPFKNRSEGDAFRVWVNDKYPSYAKEIDLDRSGRFNNPTIQKAWAKYGTEYLSRSAQTTVTQKPAQTTQKTYTLDEIRKIFVDGGKMQEILIDRSRNRVRGLIIDGYGIGANNIYMNVSPDNSFYFEDGNDSNKKVGKWSGELGNVVVEVEGARTRGAGSLAAYQMAKALYPNAKDFASTNYNDGQNTNDVLFNSNKMVSFVDSNDALL